MKAFLKLATAVLLICSSLYSAFVNPIDDEVIFSTPCPVPDPNDPRCGFYD